MSIEKDCEKRRDREYCRWKKAKKEKRLSEYRRELRREASRAEELER